MTVSKVPSTIRIRRQSRCLELRYGNGAILSLPFEYLRVFSPSAEVRGHGGGEGHLVAGKSAVALTGAEPVGNYALKLTFDDGHDSGLFTWEYLQTLGENYEARWTEYLERLDRAGLSRDPETGDQPQVWDN